MNTPQNLDNILDESLVSDELVNITSELMEVGFDSLLKDGILKEVPIIGTFVGLAKFGFDLRNRLFLKKILHFLYQIKDIPSEKRQFYIDKINRDEKFRTKVGETVILLIDKLNDFAKADYLGKLFAASVDGKINHNMFLKLANIIDRCHISDLYSLIPIYHKKDKEVNDTEKDILYNLGLLTNLGIDGNTYMYNSHEDVPNKKNIFEINGYGRLLVELLLSDNSLM
jgi:hypothetical protein